MNKPVLKVYVAGPYTKGDVCLNVRAAIQAADELWAHGFIPFIPHLTHLWHLICPHPYEDWLALDLHWMRACDLILRIPGESSGADAEVREALRLERPVFHSVKDIIDTYGRARE